MNITNFIKLFLSGIVLLFLSSCGNDNPTVDCLTCNETPQIEEPAIEEPAVDLRDCTYTLLGDNPITLPYDSNYSEFGIDGLLDGAGNDINISTVVIDASDINLSNVGEYEVIYSSDLCDNITTRVVIIDEPVEEVINFPFKILPQF